MQTEPETHKLHKNQNLEQNLKLILLTHKRWVTDPGP